MPTVKKIIFTVLFLVTMQSAMAQSTQVKKILTADSLASGNLKDLLTSFFQLSFNNLTNRSRELNFNSNPYAVILRTNPSAAIDTNYRKYRVLRKINFGFGLKLDTAYRFNGFSSGIKYAIINRRDSTTSRLLFRNLGTDSLSLEINALQDSLTDYIEATYDNNPPLKLLYQRQTNLLLSDSTVLFKQLDTSFQKIVKKVTAEKGFPILSRLFSSNPKVNLRKESQVTFSDLKKELQQKLLWTISVSDTTYRDQFLFSNLVFRTEILKGMGKSKPGANWEFSIPATLNIVDDTLRPGRDLKRAVFSFEPGLNLVIRDRGNEHSFFELKFSGEYRHNFHRLYQNEKRDKLYFNGTFRVKVFADIWIPLEFKYDPLSGNVLGFISAKLNFSGQNKK
jgi:hypothetical protein